MPQTPGALRSGNNPGRPHQSEPSEFVTESKQLKRVRGRGRPTSGVGEGRGGGDVTVKRVVE